ncbi:MAG: AMP-binding protein [Clostridia bacterium]|nr:AMP-binding protein [Clostridia bacterium]
MKYTAKNHKKLIRNISKPSDAREYLHILAEWGDKPAIFWKENGENKEISFYDFSEMCWHFGAGLRKQFGNVPGENVRIAIIGETSVNWLAAYMGTLAAGYVAIPMDKELAPAEIHKFLESVDACALVHSATFRETFGNIAAEHATVKFAIPFGTDAEQSDIVIPYNTILENGKVHYEACLALMDTDEENEDIAWLTEPVDTERMAEMLFTSGTTGTSKCVMLCQKNIFSVISNATECTEFTENDVLVSVLPIHHTYELACFFAGLTLGAQFCINDSLRNVMKNFKEYRPTALVLVPLFVNTMYKKILSEANRSGKGKVLELGLKLAGVAGKVGIDLSNTLFKDVRDAFGGRLVKIICGGARLDPSLIPTFDRFGIAIYEGFGITECSPLVAVTPYYKRKCGSVGPAVPCCEIRIDGTNLTDDGFQSGEIQVKGDNVMLGYYNNPEANADAFTEDGWFRTGDVGHLDKDGYLYITGRMKSVIVLDNGKNVFPEEIEEYLEPISLIAESVVVGREEDGVTVLTAVVFPNAEAASAAGLDSAAAQTEIQKQITALNKQLPSFKQIHKIEFRKTEFEKTTSRKIKRHLV